jgi:hypothetical protein
MALSAGPRRGELVTIAMGGDYGKPRPALVIQSDAFVDLPSGGASTEGRLRREALTVKPGHWESTVSLADAGRGPRDDRQSPACPKVREYAHCQMSVNQ